MAGRLETKARFISQVITGDNLRSAAPDDIGGQELSYAEVKAIASGNPAVLTLAEADAELQRLTLLKKNHADEQYLARRNIRELPGTIEHLRQRLEGVTADMATVAAHQDDGLTLDTRYFPRDEAVAALAERLGALPQFTMQSRKVPLGSYRGLRFGLVLHGGQTPDVFLEGASTHQSQLSRDHPGARAILNALERLAGGFRFGRQVGQPRPGYSGNAAAGVRSPAGQAVCLRRVSARAGFLTRSTQNGSERQGGRRRRGGRPERG